MAMSLATTAAVGGVFVCAYNDQDHFAYLDANGNIQDAGTTGPRTLEAAADQPR